MTFLFILLAILLFGLLILIHEGGHYLTARLFHVQVDEFSIGMGPKLLQKRSKKTGIAYSLRALPIGGYVAMEGEDGEDPALAAENAAKQRNGEPFYTKPVWQRMIITAAGAVMNLLLGVLLMLLFTLLSPVYGSNVAATVPADSAEAAAGLLDGDRIVAVNGCRTYCAYDLFYEISLSADKDVSFTVEREGEKLTLNGIRLATETEDGRNYGVVSFKVYRAEKNFRNTLKLSFAQTRLSMKMVWDSLVGLIRGDYGLKDLSGPVGVTNVMKDAAKTDLSDAKAGGSNHTLLYLVAIITVNLGLFNLLPIPALDGGRLFFQLIELIIRRPVPQKVESTIHAVGLVLLLLLMLVVTCKDVIGLF